MQKLNNVKRVMCRIIKELKAEHGWTYDDIIMMTDKGDKSINKKQLTMILKHEGKGVSTDTLDYILYYMGYITNVMITTHYELY